MGRGTSRRTRALVLLAGLTVTRAWCADAAPDPLSWLEDRHGERALDWVRTQNARTFAQLGRDSRFEAYRRVLSERAVQSTPGAGWLASDGWINRISHESGHERGVWQRTRYADFARRGQLSWVSLLDLDALSAEEGRHWLPAGDLAETVNCPGPAVRRCLLALAENGSDDRASVREFDVEQRRFVPGGFAVDATSRFWVEWWDPDTLLIAPDLGPSSLTVGSSPSPFTVRLWRRGTSIASAREVWRGSPQDADRVLILRYVDETGRNHILIRQQHTSRLRTHWLLDEDARPRRIDIPADASVRAIHRGHLVFVIEKDWQRGATLFRSGSALAIPLAARTGGTAQTGRALRARQATEVSVLRAPGERDSSFEKDMLPTSHGVLAVAYVDMDPRVFRFDVQDGTWRLRELMRGSKTSLKPAMSDPRSPEALVLSESFTQPPTLWAVDAVDGTTRALESSVRTQIIEKYIVERREARSADGTRIPYSIVRQREPGRAGAAPTLLYAYGGNYGSKWPQFTPAVEALWLRKGGVFVVANVRGGAEFGPLWHQAATGSRKQRAVDDVIAVADRLIRDKVTVPRRLGIEGESTGGLVMGAALVQRPDLFHAAVLDVPELDMIRYVALGGGRSVEEYGSPAVPGELAALRRISPYANLRSVPGFPVPLVMSSTEDGIVHPAHARKFAAKLESLGMSGLYYESPTGGHYRKQLPPADGALVEAYRYVYLAQRLMD